MARGLSFGHFDAASCVPCEQIFDNESISHTCFLTFQVLGSSQLKYSLTCHCCYPCSLTKYQSDEIHLTVIVFVLGFSCCNGENESLIAVVFVAIATALLGSLDFIGTHPSYEC